MDPPHAARRGSASILRHRRTAFGLGGIHAAPGGGSVLIHPSNIKPGNQRGKLQAIFFFFFRWGFSEPERAKVGNPLGPKVLRCSFTWLPDKPCQKSYGENFGSEPPKWLVDMDRDPLNCDVHHFGSLPKNSEPSILWTWDPIWPFFFLSYAFDRKKWPYSCLRLFLNNMSKNNGFHTGDLRK